MSPAAAALLQGPDHHTSWVVLGALELTSPPEDLAGRIRDLQSAVPLVAARLRGTWWVPGPLPEVTRADPYAPELRAPFDLAREPPARVALSRDGRTLTVAVHHAVFDGLGLVALLRALAGGVLPRPVDDRPEIPTEPRRANLGRLLRPAGRVAPSPDPPADETLAARDLTARGGHVTARLAAAATVAAVRHNRRHGAPLRRVGISVGIGGPVGAGYVSSYRRVDLAAGGDVVAAVSAAIEDGGEPPVARLGRFARLLSPVSDRVSDTFLVSNVGRHALPGATRLRVHPVARGASAVAFGLAAVEGGGSTLTIRARDLADADAERLLADAVDTFEVEEEE